MQTGKPSDHTQPDTDVESNEYRIPRGRNTLRKVQSEAVRLEASESESIQSGSIEHTPGKADSVTRIGANAEEKRPKEKKRKTKPVEGIATPLRGWACSLSETRHSSVLLSMFIAALDSVHVEIWLLTSILFFRKSWLTFSFEQNPDSLIFWEILTLLL
jgi:hypothetical protein